MSETQWSRADRAAAALQAHVDEVTDKPGNSYGDEGSAEFDAAVLALLVDLKHLLYRAGGPSGTLSEYVDRAVNVWAVEADTLPAGPDDE